MGEVKAQANVAEATYDKIKELGTQGGMTGLSQMSAVVFTCETADHGVPAFTCQHPKP